MLPTNDKPILVVPDMDHHDDEEVTIHFIWIKLLLVHVWLVLKAAKDVEKHLDLPPSWVELINISPKDFEKRCPEGKKVIFYKKCKVEKFAPYLLKDNMVLKISEYSDIESNLDNFAILLLELLNKLYNNFHQSETTQASNWGIYISQW